VPLLTEGSPDFSLVLRIPTLNSASIVHIGEGPLPLRISRRSGAGRHVARPQPAVARFLGFAVVSLLLSPMLCAQETTDELRDLPRNPVTREPKRQPVGA